MKHEYYYYNKEELLKAPKIPLIVMEDNAAVFKSMADEMVEEIKRKNAAWLRIQYLSACRSYRTVSVFCRYGK